jgi:exopolyphosphatase/guanosine-5'-triphosphate,3'-diphosphate pyrophosphatase
MIEAAIDIGTNTVLLLVADVDECIGNDPRPIKKELANVMQFARLGENLRKTGVFSLAAMGRAYAVLEQYAKVCQELRVDKLYAVGTSASRDAANAPEFYAKVKNELGIDVQIIPGTTEAQLSFLGGLLDGQDPATHAVLDIGGGSTEFVVWDEDNHNLFGQSIDMGCVAATEFFLRGDPYEKASVQELEKGLSQIWKNIKPELGLMLKNRNWVAVAGTPTTLAATEMHLTTFDPTKINGYRLERCHVADALEHFALQTNREREDHPLIGHGRADVMVAGCALLLTAMEAFDKNEVFVSCQGLRHGLLKKPSLIAGV